MTPAQQALGGRWRKLKDGAYSRKYAEGLSGVVWWRPIVGMWGGQLYFKNLAQPGYTGPDGVVCLMDRLTGKHQEHELDNAVRLMALGANPALLAAVREEQAEYGEDHE